MEQGKQSPLEARVDAIEVFFGEETKKISDEMARTKALPNGVDTNGTVVRKQQILHLKDRQTELDHVHAFVSRVLTNATHTSEIPDIGYYFIGKLDEIDIEIGRTELLPYKVTVEKGIVKRKKPELAHLATIREDILRVGNSVLDLLGQPPLVDEKNPATT